MDRWTMEELQRTDNIDFAISILNERRAKLTPYSPLGMKLAEAAHTLAEIKQERDRYMERVAEITADEQPEADGELTNSVYDEDHTQGGEQDE